MSDTFKIALISATVSIITALIAAFATIASNRAPLDKASVVATQTQDKTDKLLTKLGQAQQQLAQATPNWTSARVEPGWSLYGAPYSDPSYTKDLLGFVHLRGLAKGGGQDKKMPLMFLPEGFRPNYQMQVVVACGGGTAVLPCLAVIETDGRVWFDRLDPKGWVGLDTVAFMAAEPSKAASVGQ